MGYINLDEKFMPKSGRKGVCLSRTELFAKIKRGLNEDAFDGEEDFCLNAVMQNNPRLKQDITKICFDTENFDYETGFLKHRLIGYHCINSELSFLGCDAGGDWETPLFFIIYWDGKNLRGYVPTCGNTFNAIFKTAFFSETETPLAYDKFLRLLNEFGIKSEDELWDCPEKLVEAYNAKYGTGGTVEDLTIHEESILKDICTRFGIVH